MVPTFILKPFLSEHARQHHHDVYRGHLRSSFPCIAIVVISLIIVSVLVGLSHQQESKQQQLSKCHKQLAKNIIFDRVVSLYRNDDNIDKITELLELQIASVNKECLGIPLMFNPSDVNAYKIKFTTDIDEMKKRDNLENIIRALETEVPACSEVIVEMIIAKQALTFVENRLQVKDSKVKHYLKEHLEKCGQSTIDIFKKLDSTLSKQLKLELTELFEVETIHSSLVTVPQSPSGHLVLAEMFATPAAPIVLSATSAITILLLIISTTMLCLSKKSITVLKGEIETLVEDKKETVKKFEEKEVKFLDDIKSLSESLDSKEKQVLDMRAGLEKTLEEERFKISELEHEISNTKEGNSEEKKKLLSQLKEKEGIVVQLGDALEQVLNLRQEFEEEKLELQKKSELLDSSLKITMEELEEMNEQYDRVNSELSKKLYDIDLLQQKNTELKKSVEEGQKEVREVKGVLDSISDNVIALNNEKKIIEDELHYTNMEKVALKEETKHLTTQIHNLQNRSPFGEGTSIAKERDRLVSFMLHIDKAIFLLEKSLLASLGGIYFERDSDVLTKILELKTFVKEVIQKAESVGRHNQVNDVTLPNFDAPPSPQRSLFHNSSFDESYDKISPIRSPTTPRKTVTSPRIKHHL